MAINFFAVIGITLLLSVVGGGLGWFFFVRSRSKKVVWFANVYQLGLGVRKGFGDVLELSDLRPYCKDILEKVFDELETVSESLKGLIKGKFRKYIKKLRELSETEVIAEVVSNSIFKSFKEN